MKEPTRHLLVWSFIVKMSTLARLQRLLMQTTVSLPVSDSVSVSTDNADAEAEADPSGCNIAHGSACILVVFKVQILQT